MTPKPPTPPSGDPKAASRHRPRALASATKSALARQKKGRFDEPGEKERERERERDGGRERESEREREKEREREREREEQLGVWHVGTNGGRGGET